LHVHNPLYHQSELRRWAFEAVRAVRSQEVTEQTGNSRYRDVETDVEEYGFVGRRFREVTTGAAHCGFDVVRFQAIDKLLIGTLPANLGGMNGPR